MSIGIAVPWGEFALIVQARYRLLTRESALMNLFGKGLIHEF
jgi:hypothetical protein